MMPAASNKNEPKPSTEGGDISKAMMSFLEKRIRNIEKRKSKLDAIQQKKDAGDTLEKEQQETLKDYDQVVNHLDFIKEVQKSLGSIAVDVEKQQKKQMKREKQEKAALELKRTADILTVQMTLDSLGSETVREHFKTGKHGAVVLTDDNLKSFDELFKLISPPAAGDSQFLDAINTSAEHMNCLIEGRDRAVAGSTYKELLDLLHDVIDCGYFERAREAEEEPSAAVEEEKEVRQEEEESASPPEVPPPAVDSFPDAPQTDVPNSSPVQPPPTNLDEASLSHSQQVLQPGVGSHEAPAAQYVGQMPMAASPTMFPTAQMEAPPQPPANKARPLAEIVSAVGGTFCFLQESEIDLDSPHIDPAVVAAQPMMRPPSAPSQQPPQTNLMPAGFPAPPLVDQPGDADSPDPLSLSQQSMTQSNLDFSGASQSFAQAGLSHSQNLSSGVVADAMFQPSVEESPAPSQQQHTPHGMMGQPLGSGESVAQYELPPSIPLPPSQQAQQDGSQMSGQEKKFQLNASATEFQSRSMYSQMPPSLQNLSSQGPPPSQPQPPHQQTSHPEPRPMAPPSTVNTDFPSAPNFAQAAGDFSQAGGNYQSGNFQRGGRGGGPGNYRGGPRGGRGNNTGNTMQNGFNSRPQNGNGRTGNRGGTSFQGFPPRNDYRPDGFQGYNSNGFGGPPYQKRGGGGGGGSGNGGPGYNRGGNNRGAGGMRGGMARGGPPRGAGGNRGGMNRPGNQ